jgi:hypothetical protein
LGQDHPLVLVGHSFGGIVIKSLLIEIHKISQQQHCNNLGKSYVKKANAFLKNMLGVAFYAVPHIGSQPLIEYICRECEIRLDSKQLAKVLENIDPRQQIYQMISLTPWQVAQTFMVFMCSSKPNLLMIMW